MGTPRSAAKASPVVHSRNTSTTSSTTSSEESKESEDLAAGSAPKQAVEREQETEQIKKAENKKDEDVPKASTIANRTFDTDTEESEVFYQSYQTKQLSKESSDEFDF